MEIVNGNILDMNCGIICHQVNCKKVAGSGLALQIRKKWPKWLDDYISYDGNLGEVRIYKINDKLKIANIYSQYNYGRNKLYTNYESLEKCFIFLNTLNEKIYIPYGIGCGLGGGDWNIVYDIICKNIPNAVIVKLGGVSKNV